MMMESVAGGDPSRPRSQMPRNNQEMIACSVGRSFATKVQTSDRDRQSLQLEPPLPDAREGSGGRPPLDRRLASSSHPLDRPRTPDVEPLPLPRSPWKPMRCKRPGPPALPTACPSSRRSRHHSQPLGPLLPPGRSGTSMVGCSLNKIRSSRALPEAVRSTAERSATSRRRC